MMNKEEIITCIKCAPNKNAEVVQLKQDLRSLQEAVDGYIEYCYPFDDDNICVLCNEEGKLIPLDFSRPVLDDDNNIFDLVAGTCYIMGCTPDGYNRSLTDDEIKYYMKLWFYPIEVFKWVMPNEEVIDIRPFDGNTGRKVKAYGR